MLLTERKRNKHTLNSRVEFLQKRKDEVGNIDRLSIELAEDLVWQVGEVLTLLCLLNGFDLLLGALDGVGDGGDVGQNRFRSRLLLLVAGVCGEVGDGLGFRLKESAEMRRAVERGVTNSCVRREA